ncbi:MAG: hypothetical protein ABIF71_07065 [Planctomycetota bacterium]
MNGPCSADRAAFMPGPGADPAVLALFFDRSDDLVLVHRKQERRVVYRLGAGYLFKHYRIDDIGRLKSRGWEREAAAGLALAGAGAPRSYGYMTRPDGRGMEVIAGRAYLEGAHVGAVSAAEAPALATLFAGVHSAGVTTEDPVYNNFIRTADGYMLIDLDQAKVHAPGRGRWFFMGKELANIRLKVLDRDRAAWRAFKAAYRRAVRLSLRQAFWFHCGYWWWYLKKWRRYILPVLLGRGYVDEGRSRVPKA